MFAHVECNSGIGCPVQIFDLKSGKLSALPGSGRLRTARWSPDGRNAAAIDTAHSQLRLFDFRTEKWRTIAGGTTGDVLEWSRDSAYVYGLSTDPLQPGVFRVRIADRHYEMVASLREPAIVGRVEWFGLAPDGSLVVFCDERARDVYAMDWQVP